MGKVSDLAIRLGEIRGNLEQTHNLLEQASGATGCEAVRDRLRKVDDRINQAMLWMNEVEQLWPELSRPEADSPRTPRGSHCP